MPAKSKAALMNMGCHQAAHAFEFLKTTTIGTLMDLLSVEAVKQTEQHSDKAGWSLGFASSSQCGASGGHSSLRPRATALLAAEFRD